MTLNLRSYGFILLVCNAINSFPQADSIKVEELAQKVDTANELLDTYNYDDALDDFNEVLAQLETPKTSEEKKLKANTYSSVAKLFRDLNFFEDALDYNQRGIDLLTEVDDMEGLGNLYNNRGIIYFYYFESGVTDFALTASSRENYMKAIELKQSLNENADVSGTYVNIGNSFLQDESLQKAEEWTLKGKNFAQRVKNNGTKIYADLLLTRIYLDQRRPKESTELALTNLEFIKANPEYNFYRESFYHNLHDGYKQLDQPIEALNYLEKKVEIIEAREDLTEEDFASIVTSRETNRIREKAKELETNLNETEIKADKIRRTNYALLLLLGTLALLGYNLYSGQALKRKNLELEMTKQEQQAELDMVNAMMDGKEIERKEIGRFLHDHVSALVNAANIQLEVMASEHQLKGNKKLDTTQTILDDIADKVRNLSHQLLSNVLQKFGLAVAFEELCERLTGPKISFSFSSNLPEGKRYNDAIENKLYGIAQELCNNVLKHSEATHAKIELDEDENDLIFRIADNGVGFKQEDIKTGGVGLHEVKTRINSMGGDLEIYSNGETKITIKIPKSIATQYNLSNHITNTK